MLTLALLAAAAAPAAKTMATDDWHAMTISAIAQPGADGTQYLKVATGDVDGDGRADDGVLRFRCAAGNPAEAAISFEHEIRTPRDQATGQASGRLAAPRDLATGQASGRRTEASTPLQWTAATAELSARKPSYNIKELKGNERHTADGWQMLSLQNTDGLCSAAQAAAAAIVKSKSNITNN